jgi:TRAP-type C4-dicarboxylate transport system substrate-binding protein
MRKLLLAGVLALFLVAVLACGAAEESEVSQPTEAAQAPTEVMESTEVAQAEPTEVMEPTEVAQAEPTEVMEPTEVAQMGNGYATLEDAAADLAGGPGAIYVGGDLSRMVGTVPGNVDDALGDGTGNVPLEFLEKNKHIFETDYYRSLLEKANFTNPTALTSSDEEIEIQYACINRSLLPCKLQIVYFTENIRERTNGQVDFQVSSYPELGLAGSDMIELIEGGTIEFAQIQPAYVGGTWPLIDIIYVWGLWKDFKSEHEANTALLPALDQGIYDNTDGGKLIYHIWYGGNDQYFFSNRGAELEDFDGLKTRSHGTTMTDAINGLGGEGTFMAFADVYTALERGILDAGVTGAHAGHGQRWYEVTDNLVGPFISMPMGFETMNKDTWEDIPDDLQAIIIEEGAKMELENLRLAAVWNETGVKVNTDQDMTFLPWSDEMKQFVYEEVALGRVLPNWIKRVGPEEIALWNEIVAPWAKVEIGDDGSITAVE